MLNYRVDKRYEDLLDDDRWYVFKGEVNGLFVFIDEDDDSPIVLVSKNDGTPTLYLYEDHTVKYEFKKESLTTAGSYHNVVIYDTMAVVISYGITTTGLLILRWEETNCFYIFDTNKIENFYDPMGVSDEEGLSIFVFKQ